MKLVYSLISSQISLQKLQFDNAQKSIKKSKETFEKFDLNITNDLKILEDPNLVFFFKFKF